MRELKPCPFCGGEANLTSDYSSDHDHTFWQVWHDCSTNPGPIRHAYGHALGMEISTPWCASEDAAVELWNRRAERTCHMEYNEQWSHDEYYPTECYNCSECGHMTYDGVPTFCPNCGARVVEEVRDDADR